MFWDVNLLGLSDAEYDLFCKRAEEWYKEYIRRGFQEEISSFSMNYPLDFDCTCGDGETVVDIEKHSDFCIVGRCVKYRKRNRLPLIRTKLILSSSMDRKTKAEEITNWQKNLRLPKNRK